MSVRRLGVALVAAVAVGCGEGRAIFDIDVYSFIKADVADTLPYFGPLPPGTPDTIPVQEIRSLGIGGSSIVDTVRVTGTVDFINSTGSGTVTYAVYFDSDEATVYSSAPAFIVTATVNGAATTTSAFDIPNLPDAVRPLFLGSSVFVGIRASVTPTTPPVQGKATLTALRTRIVIQDKVF